MTGLPDFGVLAWLVPWWCWPLIAALVYGAVRDLRTAAIAITVLALLMIAVAVGVGIVLAANPELASGPNQTTGGAP